MENIVKYAVECGSMYGVVALAITFLGFITLGIIAYKTIQLALPYIYKSVCKYCNTVKKYDSVHTKANVKDVSFETELHR